MNENLGHNRTKDAEVTIANISKENVIASLEGCILTIGVNVGFLQQVLE